jgi:hypothetical protein
MLPFGVTIQATVPQGSEIPEGLMNNPVYVVSSVRLIFSDDRVFKGRVGLTSTYTKFISMYTI